MSELLIILIVVVWCGTYFGLSLAALLDYEGDEKQTKELLIALVVLTGLPVAIAPILAIVWLVMMCMLGSALG
jgi:ABC-type sulfate transport system permease subunit